MSTTPSHALLIERARLARQHAHVPYSKFAVGAALLTEDGSLYSGCNIENCSYGLTNCAERTAIFKAMSEGHRRITALAVIGDTEGPIAPCGACRQVMAEFAGPDTVIYLTNLKGEVSTTTMAALLPGAFSPADVI